MEKENPINERDINQSVVQRATWFVLDVILFIIVLFIVVGVTSVLANAVLQASGISISGNGIWPMMLSTIFSLVASLVGGAAVYAIHRLPFSQLGLSLRGSWADLGAGMLFAVALYAVGFGLSLLLGIMEVTDVHAHFSDLIASFVLFLFVALFEEVLTRGFLLGRMLDYGMNRFVALFFSSLAFSSLHFANPNFTWLPFINILLAGVLLGASYLYTRNLCFPIALHWFWNWLQGPVLGYEVSGTYLCDSVLAIQPKGSDVWSGGSFGFEGSLLCTILMCIGIAIIIGYYESKRKV